MAKKVPFYDLHCHVLPGMDDGAKDVEMSLAMLRETKEQGCVGLIATSHYYGSESIASFLARRSEAYGRLMDALEREDPEWIGRIGLGAEAAYHQGLAHDPDLEKLCFGKSRYMLLEMPFSTWTSTVIRDVGNLVRSRQIRPIIAHLERYANYAGEGGIDALLDEDVMIQMNAGGLCRFGRRRPALQMVRSGVVDVLGSDMHNTTSRPPTLGEGIRQLYKNRCGEDTDRILRNNERIFMAAMQGEV